MMCLKYQGNRAIFKDEKQKGEHYVFLYLILKDLRKKSHRSFIGILSFSGDPIMPLVFQEHWLLYIQCIGHKA